MVARRPSRSTIPRPATRRSSVSRRPGLAAAVNAGLPVLPGWVLPLEASAAAIVAGARALETAGPPRAYLAAMETVVPAGLDEALVSLRRPRTRSGEGTEPGGEPPDDERLVVRSRPILDDDGRWSGAFASYLGIEEGDLPTAVRGCWASAFSSDALGRCGEAGVDVDTVRIGVLVQPFVTFDAGGTARIRRRRRDRRRRGAGRAGGRGRRSPRRPRRGCGGGRGDPR